MIYPGPYPLDRPSIKEGRCTGLEGSVTETELETLATREGFL
jgi:hypothetical protein